MYVVHDTPEDFDDWLAAQDAEVERVRAEVAREARPFLAEWRIMEAERARDEWRQWVYFLGFLLFCTVAALIKVTR